MWAMPSLAPRSGTTSEAGSSSTPKRVEKYPLNQNQTGPWRDVLALLDASFPRSRAELEAHFRVLSVVQTNAKEPSSPQTVIVTSDGPMQMDQVKMYAVFNVHVVAIDQDTGRELHADKMEIWFDQATKHIKKAICTGHVKAIQGPNVSYSDQMIYMGDTQILTMIGRPKIVFDTGSTKGNGMFQPLGK